MAIIIDGEGDESISIDEFVSRAQQVNLQNEQELISLAPAMRQLANNKTLLSDFIHAGLADYNNFQSDNPYSSQSYILAEVSDCSFLRFAIWAPLNYGEKLNENDFYSYGTAHDHNFSLLTAGMLGSGYTTSIYQLEPGQKVIGYVGEDVRLTAATHVQLSRGRVMLYEAGKDIHVQHPAPDLSISLNLIVGQAEKYPQQFYYDVERQKIAGYVSHSRFKRGVFFRYAATLGDELCIDALWEIADSHPCETTRLYAFRTIAASTDLAVVKEKMLRDPSLIVRSSAQRIDGSLADLHVWD